MSLKAQAGEDSPRQSGMPGGDMHIADMEGTVIASDTDIYSEELALVITEAEEFMTHNWRVGDPECSMA